jgi:hypothetical protein
MTKLTINAVFTKMAADTRTLEKIENDMHTAKTENES